MHVVGTAGHVDHGKSSLVFALTGTNPDRWAEEQRRGMTLDLGFARLDLGGGVEAAIVDVPGHERFLHNMLAGAAGMELLLLVVDAVEGVMPQTREHLDVLRFLNIRRCIVAMTKVDLLDQNDVDSAQAALHASLEGTIAGDAPIVPVSSVTQTNLERLRDLLREALRSLPPRPVDAPVYLPIDRVFSLPGHGTIVTGTLMQGVIAVGDALVLQPSGKPVRVRGLQTFNTKCERVEAGARAAANLPAIGADEIARGEALVSSQFRPATTFNVAFEPLPEALPLLRKRNAVRAYIGSGEIVGTLTLEDVPAVCESVNGVLQLRTATVAPPNAPFVLRRLSPKNLLGGGRLAPAAHEETSQLQRGPLADRVLRELAATRSFVCTVNEIAAALNAREEDVTEALTELEERGEVLAVSRPPAYVARSHADEVLARALDAMRAHEASEPWALGTTSIMLSRLLNLDEALLVRLFTAFVQDGRIAHRAGYYSTPKYVPQLTQEQQALFDGMFSRDSSQPFIPVALVDVVRAVKDSRIPGIGKAFDTLLAKGALVKVNDDVYRGAQIAAIRARLEGFLRSNERMTAAQFRDLVGTSRKYAVPLLEWFDARGVTVRSGDFRMLRKRP